MHLQTSKQRDGETKKQSKANQRIAGRQTKKKERKKTSKPMNKQTIFINI
jgi:hypothetical protein